MKKEDRLNTIKEELKKSRKILNVLSDENRQNILLVLLNNCSDGGIRVDDIAKKVNLSSPPVSYHLKMLLDNNIVSIEHIGTKKYYHITGSNEILSLKSLLRNVELYAIERKEELK